jgi:hypothetical protein
MNGYTSPLYGPDVNYIPSGSVRPGAGRTLGQIAGAGSAVSLSPTDVAGTPATAAPVPFGWGHPLVVGGAIVVALILAGVITERSFKGQASFENIKVGGYNAIATAAMVIPGIYLFKLVGFAAARQFPGNGFSAFVAGI